MMSFKRQPESSGPGNVWGWKFSLIGLAVILFFVLLAYFRWVQLGKPDLSSPPAVEAPIGE
jgi:hypothetical protein